MLKKISNIAFQLWPDPTLPMGRGALEAEQLFIELNAISRHIEIHMQM